MTEAETRAALRAFAAVGDIERWITEQSWEAIPGGWRVEGQLQGCSFWLTPVPNGVPWPAVPVCHLDGWVFSGTRIRV